MYDASGGAVVGWRAYSLHNDAQRRSPFIITCEHARNHVPEPWRWPSDDAHWLETHWGYDIGIADVALALLPALDSAAVFAEFSRLLCDPNRPWDHQTAIRRDVEGGHTLALNARIDEAEQARRRQLLYDAYHAAVDEVIARRVALAPAAARDELWLLSLHSYTADYLGERRDYDCGVLFDDYEDEAARLGELLARQGFDVRLNEPYSGKDGLVYSIQRHGLQHDLRYIEIELRQDTIDTPDKAASVASRMLPALSTFARLTSASAR
ncbi:MAG: N-formylglutamate amidohydrolase [Myxococcales bacterium]|nr:N-formylglutamate amidohydrolase [Myxococcales bacterium]